MKKSFSYIIQIIIVFFLITIYSCENPDPTLKDAFKDHFEIGVAVNPKIVSGKDSNALEIVKTHFNGVTAENAMKWALIHPKPGVYNFEPADKFVEFAEGNNIFVTGHCLVWHSQTPRWVFEDEMGNPTVRDTLLQRMKDHIFTVVGRYKGRVKCWDVVNEPTADDGQVRKSRWYEIIGEDYIQKAFEYAREADPEALLILNDYSLPNQPKRECMVGIIKDLQAKGIRIDGIGLQAHYLLDYPTMEDLEASIVAFAELGPRIMITEMDIDVLPRAGFDRGADIAYREEYRAKLNPYTEGLPDSVASQLAKQYGDMFTVFVKHADKIDRVTLWGVHDGQSWKNNFPVRGRTNYPLLFDRDYQPKLAFYAVMEAAGR